MDKLGPFDRIWAREGKALKSVIDGIVPKIDETTTGETIWAMVQLADIKDESDRLRTFQALMDIRREIRVMCVRVQSTLS